ncbi:MAG: hypothetical protein U0Y96_14205 [Candidatus Kapaibacterium sp.]|nr:hypothetical protein [Bacteroidota bacterium]
MKPPRHEHNDIMNALEEHYAYIQLTATQLAEILGISESHLCRVCVANYGKTTAKLIHCFRIKKAVELRATLGEKKFTCRMVGYVNIRTYKKALQEHCNDIVLL